MSTQFWHLSPGGLGLRPLDPGAVVLWIAVALCAVWVARRTYQATVPSLAPRRRRLLVLLRAGSLVLLLFLLLEPRLVSHRETVVDPTLLLLVDDSASMAIVDEEEGSRLEAARLRSARVENALRTRFPSVRIRRAAGSRRVRVAGPWDFDAARGEGTDLRSLLVSAQQRHLDDNLRGIVLFSDGRNTGRAGGGRGVDLPIFAVALGDSAGSSDLRLDRLRHPAVVRRGDRLEIRGEVVVQSAQPGSTRVEIRREGELLDAQDLSWVPGTGRQPFHFVVEADSLGWQRLEVVVEPVAGEILTQNNRLQVAYEVQKDRLRVLFYALQPSWDTHFLRRVAQRDPRFDFLVAYRGADGMRVAAAGSTLVWPLGTQEVEDVDLFVAASLSDYARLSQEVPLSQLVEAGSGLWVLGANAVGPGLPRLSEGQSALLPLRPRGRWRWTTGEYRAEVAVEGRSSPLLEWPPSVGEVDARLAKLPPMDRALGPLDPAPDAEVVLQMRSGPWTQPLLALRTEGQGRIAMWSAAPLWPWSFWRLGQGDNEELFAVLMQNLMAQLAEGSSRDRLRLQLPARVIAVGSDALVRATVLDAQFRPDSERELWLEWIRADATDTTAVQRLPMRLDPDAPGGRVQALPTLSPGDYRLRVVAETEQGPQVGAWSPLTVDAYSVEYRDPRPDVAGLRALTESSGGRLLKRPEDLRWVEELDLSPRRDVKLSRLDLWSSWWALVPFLLLVGGEWTLRRRWGLL